MYRTLFKKILFQIGISILSVKKNEAMDSYVLRCVYLFWLLTNNMPLSIVPCTENKCKFTADFTVFLL